MSVGLCWVDDTMTGLGMDEAWIVANACRCKLDLLSLNGGIIDSTCRGRSDYY